MDLALRIDNNVVAIILSIIFLMNIFNRLDKKEKKNQVFITMFILNVLELIVETLTCIIDKQPRLLPIRIGAHVILFILGPAIIYMWYYFTDLWINRDKKFRWINNVLVLMPLFINTLVALVTPSFKLVFYISDSNVYTRGVLFFVPVVVSYFYLICSFILTYINKGKINKTEYLPLLLFGVFPAVGGLIQSLFYGFLLMWSSTAFALIVVYIYLQQHLMHIDLLTGAWTREKLHTFLNNRIEQNKIKNFSIVFIDLDNFKKINDRFGHNEGDKALITLVKVISSVLRKEDSITRYGGDEFILFLNVDSNQEVEMIMDRVSNAIDKYNRFSKDPYELKFSYGYDLYDFNARMTISEYINHVDHLMYEAKKSKNVKREIEIIHI